MSLFLATPARRQTTMRGNFCSTTGRKVQCEKLAMLKSSIWQMIQTYVDDGGTLSHSIMRWFILSSGNRRLQSGPGEQVNTNYRLRSTEFPPSPSVRFAQTHLLNCRIGMRDWQARNVSPPYNRERN